MGFEDVAPVDEQHLSRDVVEFEAPVEGAIPAANDGDVLSRKCRPVLDTVVDALAMEFLLPLDANFGGMERAGAGRHDNRASRVDISLLGFDLVTLARLEENARRLTKHEFRAELDSLADHVA